MVSAMRTCQFGCPCRPDTCTNRTRYHPALQGQTQERTACEDLASFFPVHRPYSLETRWPALKTSVDESAGCQQNPSLDPASQAFQAPENSDISGVLSKVLLQTKSKSKREPQKGLVGRMLVRRKCDVVASNSTTKLLRMNVKVTQ